MYDANKGHYVAVTCIIVKDGKFLITRRANTEKTFPNQWTVPGGKLEANDYKGRPKDTSEHWYNVLENLTKREVFEETGLKVKNIRYITSLVYIRPDNIPTLIISLYADYDFGEIKLDQSLTEYAWISLEEAKNYKLIEGIYEELDMLDKILKGKRVDEWKKQL
jgi:8-oxo-dGTP pyrophosphatase MutT (NUDIX family)